jgi:hypothetical protein
MVVLLDVRTSGLSSAETPEIAAEGWLFAALKSLGLPIRR